MLEMEMAEVVLVMVWGMGIVMMMVMVMAMMTMMMVAAMMMAMMMPDMHPSNNNLNPVSRGDRGARAVPVRPRWQRGIGIEQHM